MKKVPLLFLTSLIIFASFIIISLAKSNNTNPSPSNTIISSTSTNTTPTNSNLCVVTINNQKYDVTQFRYQHSGGDIFQCGTDMSSIFAGQHSQRYLNKMKAYLIP